MSIEDIKIKCSDFSVERGHFQQPDLTIEANNADVGEMLSELGIEKVIEIIGQDDVIDYLVDQGLVVEAE